MDGKLLSPTLRPKPSLLPHQPTTPLFKPRLPPRTVAFPFASLNAGGPAPTSDEAAVNPGNEDGIGSSNSSSGSKNATPPSSGSSNSSRPAAARSTAQPRRQPAGTLNIRYRSISRKQARQQQQPAAPPPAPPPKTWEEMTLGEKAVELYVGEKGALFWLNKFAYASIFAVIGGWILFRFVGPSLGLYQLDTPPLAPTSLFKGTN